MHPVLFKLGWFEVHTYGLLLMLSFVIAIYGSARIAKKNGLNPNSMVDLGIVIIVSSLIGARLLYVAFHFDEYSDNLFDIINPLQSDGSFGIAGLSILGGVILASVSSYYFLQKKKLPTLMVFNFVAPFVALGVGITRIGCYFHGCCFGKACSPSVGVIFPQNSPAGFVFPDTPIYPTQLYASGAGFLIFFVLIFAQKSDYFKDKLFYLLIILLGTSRVIVDIFRHFEESIILIDTASFQFSSNQLISVLMIIAGIAGLIYSHNKKESTNSKKSGK